MPLKASAGLLQALIPGSQIRVYKQAAHGLYYTSAGEVIKDILALIDRAN